ncbi:MAG: thiol-activated cytolysin family protein, partial [Bacteroidia bacterium]
QPGNPATYISSVSYGRKFYLLLESTASRTEIRASIKASYDAAVSNTEIKAGAKYVDELSNVNIKVYAIGGDQTTALATFNGDFNAVATFLTEGGDYRTGVPLSYVVRSLETHQIVNVKLATQYQTSVCEPYYYDDNPPGFTAFWSQTFSRIGAIANINESGQSAMVIFNMEGDQYYVTDQNTQTVVGGPYGVHDANAILGDLPFDKVSALNYDPVSNLMYIYSGTGTLLCTSNLAVSPGNVSQAIPVGNLFSNHPFALFGIESSGRYGSPNVVLQTKKESGNEIILYYPANGSFLPSTPVSETQDFPLKGIGAVTYIDIGDGYFILIDTNGRDYTILDVANASDPRKLYKF